MEDRDFRHGYNIYATYSRVSEVNYTLVSKVHQGDKWGRLITGKVSAVVIAKNQKVKAFQPVVHYILRPLPISALDLGTRIGRLRDIYRSYPVHTAQFFEHLVAIEGIIPALEVTREGVTLEVRGQGEFHASILLEIVRSQGFELMVSRKDSSGKDTRKNVMVSSASGTVTVAALIGLQKLGTIFVSAGYKVHKGMIVGHHSQHNDIKVDPVIKGAKPKNVKSIPRQKMTLQEALAYAAYDVAVEVTPRIIRLREK